MAFVDQAVLIFIQLYIFVAYLYSVTPATASNLYESTSVRLTEISDAIFDPLSSTIITSITNTVYVKNPYILKDKSRAFYYSLSNHINYGKLLNGYANISTFMYLMFVLNAKLFNYVVKLAHHPWVDLAMEKASIASVDDLDRIRVGPMKRIFPIDQPYLKNPCGVEWLINDGGRLAYYALERMDDGLYELNPSKFFQKDWYRPNYLRYTHRARFQVVDKKQLKIVDITYRKKTYKREEMSTFHCDLILSAWMTMTASLYHLGVQHFIIAESICMATEKNLDKYDPLRVLMHPATYNSLRANTRGLSYIMGTGMAMMFNITAEGQVKLVEEWAKKQVENMIDNKIEQEMCDNKLLHDVGIWKQSLKEFISDFVDEHICLSDSNTYKYENWLNTLSFKTNGDGILDRVKHAVGVAYINAIYHEMENNENCVQRVNPMNVISSSLRESYKGSQKPVYNCPRDQCFGWLIQHYIAETGLSFDKLDTVYRFTDSENKKYNHNFKKFCNKLRRYEKTGLFKHHLIKPSRVEFSVRY